MAETQSPRIAILPSPGMGHLIPLVELAKRLVNNHNLSVTFIVPTADGPPPAAVKSVLDSLPSPAVDYVFLPPVSLSDVPPDAKIETIISITVARSLPSLRSTLSSASRRFSALVVDLFGTDAFDAAVEFGAAPYIFFPSTAMALSLFLHLPKLDESVTSPYSDLEEPVQIPGCIPIRGSDLLDPVQDRSNDAYKWLLHHSKRYRLAEGVMVNSFPELEPGPIKYLREKIQRPPVYPVGPLVNMGEIQTRSDSCLDWLDRQPHGSVLFVSFGSGGTLSYNQVTELATGLEASGQRFLWVVRSPDERTANASFFTVRSESDPFPFLPEGFLDRTRDRGLVVSSWAPQARVLSHGSTGGFLTHCGWNSTLESVVNGVPLIVWPLYAEQKMNAVMLAEDIKVALRPRKGEDGLIGREEIAGVVRRLMEGEEGKKARYRMKELKEAAARVVMTAPEGCSSKALSDVVQKWRQDQKCNYN
ncbi:unnamed protein product [Linum tenue]|uniref:Glycosyltransferase n=1 Tax=Linum tenue TaxID=586396 RepID=A0AAV0QAM2_9ROSI|nr:unnamed protein product [Linum tenue]